MYPYATQTTGEFGFQGQATYTIPKNTKLGGKTGITFSLNYSQVNSIGKDPINDTTYIGEPGTLGYSSSFFSMGDDVYYQDLSFEVTKKFGKKVKGIFAYLYQTYNKDVIEGHYNEYGSVYSNIGIADVSFYLSKKTTLRFEAQGLWTKQDKGDWLAGLLELTLAPNWFFTIQDQWNYGNAETSQRIHYYLLSAGYTHKTSRISLSYGRQREGILCVGGVCRYVPASSGFTLSLSTSF